MSRSHKPNDFHSTKTSIEQKIVEDDCKYLFDRWREDEAGTENTKLFKQQHMYYILRGLNSLSRGFTALDASRPWLVFWMIHSLELLGVMSQVSDDLANRVVDFLNLCQHPDGGFGGGPGQVAHLAPTYAATCALMIVGARKTRRAFQIINRPKLYSFLLGLKHECGAFRVSQGGEMDTRGVYCCLAVASLTNLITPELTRNTAKWVASCQTFEGGIGGEPGNEAHGGYAFCGLAALIIMKQTNLIDKMRFLKWAASRQMGLEGGFQGRTNKLVDACYSFWVGGLFPLISYVLGQPNTDSKSDDNKTTTASVVVPLLFDVTSLQEYVLVCCQNRRGGLKDKPGKNPDYYHTCYALSGLAVAQHCLGGREIFGDSKNQLEETNAVYNIGAASVPTVLEYFGRLSHPTEA